MWSGLAASTTLTNCILWENLDSSGNGETAQIDGFASTTVTVNYSCIQGWTGNLGGNGNFGLDPIFVSAPQGQYKLDSGSPCIDSGNNVVVPIAVSIDLGGDPRFIDDPDTPDTGIGVPPIVDRGAYEYQLPSPCPADVNGDGEVDVADLLIILALWGSAEPLGDVNGDGIVDVQDLLEVLSAWGPCV
jgi:hypothetical protein